MYANTLPNLLLLLYYYGFKCKCEMCMFGAHDTRVAVCEILYIMRGQKTISRIDLLARFGNLTEGAGPIARGGQADRPEATNDDERRHAAYRFSWGRKK